MPFDDSLLTYPDGTEAPQVTEDGMELEEPSKETTEDPAVLAEPAEPQLPSEFEKLFKGCEENPEDFNGWVYLLQYVEQEVRRTTQVRFRCVHLYISRIEHIRCQIYIWAFSYCQD